jgi:hypothetical protein
MKDGLSPPAPNVRQEALLAEYRAMAVNVAEQRDRAERLQDLADDARAQAEAQESALKELGGLVGIDPQLSMDQQLDARLRGQRLQEIAVRVLTEQHPDGEPIHYKEWYALLRETGYSIGGKDPQATFLSSISRSPRVRSMGKRSGLYVVVGGSAEGDRSASVNSAAA